MGSGVRPWAPLSCGAPGRGTDLEVEVLPRAGHSEDGPAPLPLLQLDCQRPPTVEELGDGPSHRTSQSLPMVHLNRMS